ncbi:peptidase M18, aminopeptidase I [Suhomyces tanzawaensis NRRL Y-17324]|uniref:Peptidase M18, aminopeptidase I n=1 Tax=Suhomyces tanzawaensis NRRL Y-17324 TaxID=984487 RepID=A0A1E4SL34_9ASCO|nr:peptidase M18, aminopeptidase I [Suhomyces tanzawaensis NRRL Y-17324]ODV80213.1 peptidase M18, aminopeptidase I [Suhomyces tanzawaensis NRRL Y-17324]
MSVSQSPQAQGTSTSTKGTNQSQDDFLRYYEGYADQYIDCMDNSPTTYHFVDHFRSVLDNNGFKGYKDKEHHDFSKPGLYYTIKDDLTVVAFIVGGKWAPEKGSIVVGTHVDSVTLKVNPRGLLRASKDGYELLGVAPYSGGLPQSILDRELGLAGAVLVKGPDGKVQRKLISTGSKPIGIIPSIAEHFGISLTPNPQTQAVPIIGFGSNDLKPTQEEQASPLYSQHPLSLIRLVSSLSNTPVSQILDLELELVNVQKGARGGLSHEFVYASNLDDRLCSFGAMYALLEFSKRFYTDKNIEDYDGLVGVYFTNNEEIGSNTRTGAGGGFLRDTLALVVASRYPAKSKEYLAQLMTHTIVLSSDVTHALNPNYKDAYLEGHVALPNTGPTVKIDVSQHVLTDAESVVFLENIVGKLPGIKLQTFHIRNDGRLGGTIGPIMSSSRRGINGAALIIDVGLPILAMHNARSIVGYKDIGMGVRFYKAAFEYWQEFRPVDHDAA